MCDVYCSKFHKMETRFTHSLFHTHPIPISFSLSESLCSSSLSALKKSSHSLCLSSLSALKKSSSLRVWLFSMQLKPSLSRAASKAAFCSGWGHTLRLVDSTDRSSSGTDRFVHHTTHTHPHASISQSMARDKFDRECVVNCYINILISHVHL